MTFYDILFDDGSTQRTTLVSMSTEIFRRVYGGLSNVEQIKVYARMKYGGKEIVRISRTLTGEILYERANCLPSFGIGKPDYMVSDST
jgi:hypothetical protein